MKLKSSFKYQATGFKNAVLVYYLVIVLINILGLATSSIMIDGETVMSNGGSEFTTLIFIFILGLCSYKENFLMLSQNGVSRRTQLFGWILAALSLCVLLSIVDNLFNTITSLIYAGRANVSVSSFYSMVYGQSGFSGWLMSALFCVTMYLFIITVGYFITIMFYRLNRPGKILVGAGVPIFLSIGLPYIETHITNGAITRAFTQFIDFALGLTAGQSFRAPISFIVFSCVTLLLCWLLMRRSVIKPQ